MVADRQHLIPCPELGAAWRGEWPGRPAGTAAWVVRLDRLTLALLRPTGSDLVDAGRRTGDARRLFLARRSALRHLIARHLGAEAETVIIGYDHRGVPRLDGPRTDCFVSVSGRGVWAGFAVAPRPVGIDIELLGAEGEIPWAVLGSAERARIHLLPRRSRVAGFLQYWTAKEAYLKMLGTGLLRDPADISVCWGDETAFSIRDGCRVVAGGSAGMVLDAGEETVVAAWFLAGDLRGP